MSDTPPEEFKNIEDLLRKVLSQALGSGQFRPGVVGVNIILAGGIPPGFPGTTGGSPNRDVEHPVIEVIEWDGRITATCELKGLLNEHVSIALAEGTLHVIGYDGTIRYRSSVLIPPVIESSCIRTFQNGILELTWLMQVVEIQAEQVPADVQLSGEERSDT
ncbi:MAG TPA: Hsp20/alpha crystallin family protein [Methanospirillum sp.]|nr:Hsp20/alpha crystallin family protein [Methanospirillum sp.]